MPAINMLLVPGDAVTDLLTIAPTGPKGELEPLDAPAAWTSSDPTIATVAASTDGNTATVTAVAPGACTITVSGTSDGDALTASQDYTVEHPAANSLNLSAGAVVTTPIAPAPGA